MKLSIIIILILSISFISTILGKCDVQPIQVGLGKSCSRVLKTYCGEDNYCSDVGICEPLVAPQSPCIRNEQCGSYSCINSTCTKARYAQVGNACDYDTDCVTSKLTCQDNVCVNNAGTCSTNYDCSYTEYCNSSTSTCNTALDIGSVCTGINQCKPGYVCTAQQDASTDFTCQEPFQGQEGEKCSGLYVKQFVNDCDIAQSLYCNTTTKICQKSPKTIQKVCSSCNNDSPTEFCGLGGKCLCYSNDTKGVGSGTCSKDNFMTQSNVDSIDAMYSCIRTNKCVFDSRFMSSLVCFHVKCKAQVCGAMEFYEPYLLDAPFTQMALQSCSVKPLDESCEPKTIDNSKDISSTSRELPSIFILSIVFIFFNLFNF